MPGQTLAQIVKAKYPGVYDDLSDRQLEDKVRAKFPGVYDDLPQTPPDDVSGLEPMTPMASHKTAEERRQAAIDEAMVVGRRLVPGPTGAPVGALARVSQAAPSLAGRVIGGARNAASSIAPAITYEAVKSGAEAVGVPTSASTLIAMAVSGAAGNRARRPSTPRRGRAKASAETPAPAAASPASPAASTPATPTPPAAPATSGSAPTSSAGSTRTPHPEGGVWSPQRVANEVGLASRRSGANLSQAEYQKAAELVTQGSTPADAVKSIVSARASAPATAPAGTVARAKLSVTEGRVYAQLIGQGKTHEEAIESILLQRQLQQRLGTPKQDEVVRRVVNRNVTGRWAE